MTDLDPCGCSDYALSRRRLLGTGAALLGTGVMTSMVGDVMTSAAFGAEPDGNVLVVLSQRGGVDGMSMVVPHAESVYYSSRPSIAIAKSRLLHADATFGLHPSFAPLSPMWTAGKVAALQAVGLPIPNRSHFDAMEEIEDADPGSVARIGWLNRMLGSLQPADENIFDGVQVGSNVVPTSLIGPVPTLALASETAMALPLAGTDSGPGMEAALRGLYATGSSRAAIAGRQALELSRSGDLLAKVFAAGPSNKATYPTSALGTSLRNAAALIRSGLGVRAIAVDSGGWDHHTNLTNLMTSGVTDLAGSLAAFFTDLGSIGSRVTVVTLSEFGRRLAENGSSGADHGYGNAVLVMGAGVKGGYHSRWPTLASGKQVEGDLAVTTDYRHVLAEILAARFPTVSRSTVFPDAGTYKPLGFMR